MQNFAQASGRASMLKIGGYTLQAPLVLVDYRIIVECEKQTSPECQTILGGIREKRAIIEVFLKADGRKTISKLADRLKSITLDAPSAVIIEPQAGTDHSFNQLLDGLVEELKGLDYILVVSLPSTLRPGVAAHIVAKTVNLLGEKATLPIPAHVVSRGMLRDYMLRLSSELADDPEVAGIVIDARGSYIPSKPFLATLKHAHDLTNSSELPIVVNARNSPRSNIAWTALVPYLGVGALGLSHIPIFKRQRDRRTPFKIPDEKLYLRECADCDWVRARTITYARLLEAYKDYNEGKLWDKLDDRIKNELEKILETYTRTKRQKTLDEWLHR